ncbi:hypothetical protein D9756_001986 [Leucocoprinus leucothites]|uniref:NAD-dependent epimerase/dehydratase domain-containing protein n=1 Tax=Leucocoprinus leucothites TaxID=201217 RepID=A0A8H5FUI5_9AGAR|nr:hypothetical protein D9756_009030 [Leucoagaricus leucothites]KAF5357977.1 hypothetical protein D9756_001986 [Leucoagaricus leucothites]
MSDINKVLVAGANGYIAMWVIRYLLEQGYSVRGTVRDELKMAVVVDSFPGHISKGSLEVVVAADATEQGAYDMAVRDVDAVIHAATPVLFSDGEPEEMIRPARDGTINLLNSILSCGTPVQRVILTSSVASIFRISLEQNEGQIEPRQPRKLTEDDWNEESLALCDMLGVNAPPLDKYMAGKIIAEKAARDFIKVHKDQITWDVVSLHPSWVFGGTEMIQPAVRPCTDPAHMNLSSKLWFDAVFTDTKAEHLGNSSGGWVDVRDVALAHVRALQRMEAGGLFRSTKSPSSGMTSVSVLMKDPTPHPRFNIQIIVDQIANKLKPTLPALLHPIAPPRPDILSQYFYEYSNDKARDILGIKFRTKEETVRDTFEEWAKYGI